jgi:hypothetical protein
MICVAWSTLCYGQIERRQVERTRTRVRAADDFRRGSQLLGTTIRLDDDDDFGTIDDFVLDANGEIVFVSVGFDDEFIPIPFGALTFTGFNDGFLLFPIERDLVLGIPRFTTFDDFSDVAFRNQLVRFFRNETAFDFTFGGFGRSFAADDFILATALFGTDVRLRGDDTFGTIDDFVFDPNGRVVFMGSAFEGQFVPIPFVAASFSSFGDGFVTLGVSRDVLLDGPRFSDFTVLSDPSFVTRVNTFFRDEAGINVDTRSSERTRTERRSVDQDRVRSQDIDRSRRDRELDRDRDRDRDDIRSDRRLRNDFDDRIDRRGDRTRQSDRDINRLDRDRLDRRDDMDRREIDRDRRSRRDDSLRDDTLGYRSFDRQYGTSRRSEQTDRRDRGDRTRTDSDRRLTPDDNDIDRRSDGDDWQRRYDQRRDRDSQRGVDRSYPRSRRDSGVSPDRRSDRANDRSNAPNRDRDNRDGNRPGSNRSRVNQPASPAGTSPVGTSPAGTSPSGTSPTPSGTTPGSQPNSPGSRP